MSDLASMVSARAKLDEKKTALIGVVERWKIMRGEYKSARAEVKTARAELKELRNQQKEERARRREERKAARERKAERVVQSD